MSDTDYGPLHIAAEAENTSLRAELAEALSAIHRLAYEKAEAEAKLARVRELCAASLGRDDYGFCPQDVLAAIEDAP